MSELPAKPSFLSRIRNNIVDIGLKNNYTRKIIANFAPALMGDYLTNYIVNKDNENLDETIELLSLMNSNSIEKNLDSLMTACKKKIDDYYAFDEIVSRMLESVSDKAAETFSLKLLKINRNESFYFTDDTYQKISDKIDVQNKNVEEMDEVINVLNSSVNSNEVIATNIFNKLTLEQKKKYFSDFVSMMSVTFGDSGSNVFSKLFSQFPDEERLEEYNKILEVYRDENNNAKANLNILSKCFCLLPEESRLSVFEDTFEFIKDRDDNSKGISFTRIIGGIPVEEQEKYYKQVFDNFIVSFHEIRRYVSSIDKSLHHGIAHEVINKLNNLKNNSKDSNLETERVLLLLDSQARNETIINIFNADLDNPDIKFICNAFKIDEIKDDLKRYAKEKNIRIMPESNVITLQRKGIDINNLSILMNDVECNLILNKYMKNPSQETYINCVEDISDFGKMLHLNASEYEVKVWNEKILEKKMNTYLNLFSSLENKDRGILFKKTLDGMLDSMNINDDLLLVTRKIKLLYQLLDERDKILQFPDMVSDVSIKNYVDDNRLVINKFFENSDVASLSSIYSLYINMINEGIGTENYSKAIHGLDSDILLKGIIEKLSNNENIPFLDEEKLEKIMNNSYSLTKLDKRDKIAQIFVESKLNRIISDYNKLDEKDKYSRVNEVLRELSAPISSIDNMHGTNYENIIAKVSEIKINAISKIFSSLPKEEKSKHFEVLYESLDNLTLMENKIYGYNQLFKTLDKEEKLQRFPEFVEHMPNNINGFLEMFSLFENDDKVNIFKNYIIANPENIKYVAEIVNKYSFTELNEIFKDKITLNEETITQLIEMKDNIAIKTLLFDKTVDREKIIDLNSYDQLQNKSINIDSVVKSLYIKNGDKPKAEFNKSLEDTYNLFTYNNIPEFMKNFRIFQLGAYYSKENIRIESFKNKTKEERDILILEDLFKISLDSNNESLRDFCNLILEGKRLTTMIQSNPEEKIKLLSFEELALLYQYRDTVFDLHNITSEIRNNNRPKVEKSGDIIKDFKTLISVYSDNKEHNLNSRNIIFNPNKIMDELFDGFITTTIRPKAMLEYMDSVKSESDLRHLEIEEKLKNGIMYLEEGDFVKGIQSFDEYIPSMLRDGIKGGEFNQEHSHSDLTPLDADFGYISKGNLKKEGATDYEIIQTSISATYGNNFIVLKNYAERLQDRSNKAFDVGTFTGSPDYYRIDLEEAGTQNSRYIRTGIPITDVDYIVSYDFNPKNGYEMAMAGIFIPVVNSKGEIVFSSDDYKRIRSEMKGLSHYNAESFEVSKKVKNVDALYEVYKGISTKLSDEIDEELIAVKNLIAGKPDEITVQKKNATTNFIKKFFQEYGIIVTDDLSQNLSSKSVELIDTGSTGRGTNVPGDGDFDFMLRHNLPPNELSALSDKVNELTPDGKFITVGDGFRAKEVLLPSGEKVDIDITTAKKSLSLSYSSDMCVRDRLNSIKENDPDKYNYVQANIIMAKKILKAKGIYKKLSSDGATEHGGFGGIGVENWILQNGGSFEQAIETFLDAANSVNTYDEFKNKYPIFDFGFNHREKNIRHDRFSAFLAYDQDKPEIGYNFVKKTFFEIQRSLYFEKDRQEKKNMESPLIQSISPEGFEAAGKTKSSLRDKFSFSKMRNMLSKFMSTQATNEIQNKLEER